jgi:hypothetical protein
MKVIERSKQERGIGVIQTTADDQALDIASCSTDAVIAYTGMTAG